MAEEQQPIPIVEHLPTAENPHPSLEGAPEGSFGHPDGDLEHEPIEHDGQVIAAPEGHNAAPQTIPSEEQVEAKLKESAESGTRWLGGILKRKQAQKEELEKAA